MRIDLPWPKPLVTPNDRLHHMQKAALMKRSLHEARWTIRAAGVPFMAGAEVDLHWRIPDRRKRDSDSLQLALKATLDALVKEGVLHDDSWVEVPRVGMHIHPPIKGQPAEMWLELTAPDQETAP